MEHSTFISCLHWVERGYAARIPQEIQMSEQEINEMKADPMIEEELRHGQQHIMEDEDDLPVFGDNLADMMNSGGIYPMAVEDVSDQEKEDYLIRETDALIVAGKVEKEHSSLEVYIYDQATNGLFVHHEIMMSSYPLDIQWLRVALGSINSNEPVKGNYAIVSSFLPEIELWNLDLVEAIQPDMILGGEIISKKKKPKKFTNGQKKYQEGSHTDSVLSLSLNQTNLGVLASGSSDHTVKIWDLHKQTNIYTMNHHTSPVKKVQWSSVDPSVMLSCSKQIGVTVVDSRYPTDYIDMKVQKGEELESACWNINNQSQIAYVTNVGGLHVMDVRKQGKTVMSQQAHKSSANGVIVGNKNMCYTCSEDETVRIWSLDDLSAPLASKNPKCGILFCLDLIQFQDGPILSVGNSKGELFVWETTQNEGVNTYYQSHP